MCGVTRQTHSYWQFYLPTTLARCNLLYALGSRPDRAFALAGAAFVAEAEHLALWRRAARKPCAHRARRRRGRELSKHAARETCKPRFERTIDTVADGTASSVAPVRAGRGGGATAGAARPLGSRRTTGLAVVDRNVLRVTRAASTSKIEIDCPDIDRDTFIEPHELCSTTHVHNDHRLVVIESGDMLFWGNLGMKLSMHRRRHGADSRRPSARLDGGVRFVHVSPADHSGRVDRGTHRSIDRQRPSRRPDNGNLGPQRPRPDARRQTQLEAR